MKTMLFICSVLLCSSLASAQESAAKPEVPVDKWARKTIMLIGAHADDDALSHGTLAMLQAHGNQVYVVTLTTGNVGTQDPNLSRTQLAEIRRHEELAALAELGIPADHYINYDHDDENTWVDISEFVEKKVNAFAKYVSQYGPGWKNYKATLSDTELK